MKLFTVAFLTICLVTTGSLYAGQSEAEFLAEYFNELRAGDISRIMEDNIQIRYRYENASADKLETMHSYVEKLYENAGFQIDKIEVIGPDRRRADIRIKYAGDDNWTPIQLFLLDKDGKWEIFDEVANY